MMCEAVIWTRDGWSKYRCTRQAKRIVSNTHYCEQHAKQAERRIARGVKP